MTTEAEAKSKQMHELIKNFDEVPEDQIAQKLSELTKWMGPEDKRLYNEDVDKFYYINRAKDAVSKLLPKAADRVPDEQIGRFLKSIFKFYEHPEGFGPSMEKKALEALLKVSNKIPPGSINYTTFTLFNLMNWDGFYDSDNLVEDCLMKIAENIADEESLNIFLQNIRNFSSIGRSSFVDDLEEALEKLFINLPDALKIILCDKIIEWNTESTDWVPHNFKNHSKFSNTKVIEFIMAIVAKNAEAIPEEKIQIVIENIEAIAKKTPLRKYYSWSLAMKAMAGRVYEKDLQKLAERIKDGLLKDSELEQILTIIYLHKNIARFEKSVLDDLIPIVRSINNDDSYDIRETTPKILDAYYEKYPEEIFKLVSTFADDKEGAKNSMSELVQYYHHMDDEQVSRMFRIFQKFAESENSDIRFWCVYYIKQFKCELFVDQKFKILEPLSRDVESEVRQKVPSSLRSIAMHVDDKESKSVFEILFRLMQETNNPDSDEDDNYTLSQNVAKEAADKIYYLAYKILPEKLGLVIEMILEMPAQEWYMIRKYQADILRRAITELSKKDGCLDKAAFYAEQSLPKLIELLNDTNQKVFWEAQTTVERISSIFEGKDVGVKCATLYSENIAAVKARELQNNTDDTQVDKLGDVATFDGGDG